MFKQVETRFVTTSIKSDFKQFYHVAAAIENEILVQVSDEIVSPPSSDVYFILKIRIIDRFSKDAHFKNYLQTCDQRPSHLLREIRDLAFGQVFDDVLKTFWLQRLSNQIKAILTANSDTFNIPAIIAKQS